MAIYCDVRGEFAKEMIRVLQGSKKAQYISMLCESEDILVQGFSNIYENVFPLQYTVLNSEKFQIQYRRRPQGENLM